MFIGLILVPSALAAIQMRVTLGGLRSLMIYESTPPTTLSWSTLCPLSCCGSTCSLKGYTRKVAELCQWPIAQHNFQEVLDNADLIQAAARIEIARRHETLFLDAGIKGLLTVVFGEIEQRCRCPLLGLWQIWQGTHPYPAQNLFIFSPSDSPTISFFTLSLEPSKTRSLSATPMLFKKKDFQPAVGTVCNTISNVS